MLCFNSMKFQQKLIWGFLDIHYFRRGMKYYWDTNLDLRTKEYF